MPAFLNPAVMLWRDVAFSHGLRVSAATSCVRMIADVVCWRAASAERMYVLKGPNTEISAACNKCVV